nr:immunoglobulin heavy chain junction region [Macaca mulatta]MOW84702.1 immunoglobulin heavy chain junction region [Macaca mulatta]
CASGIGGLRILGGSW